MISEHTIYKVFNRIRHMAPVPKGAYAQLMGVPRTDTSTAESATCVVIGRICMHASDVA